MYHSYYIVFVDEVSLYIHHKRLVLSLVRPDASTQVIKVENLILGVKPSLTNLSSGELLHQRHYYPN